jgi:hypothetical protein
MPENWPLKAKKSENLPGDAITSDPESSNFGSLNKKVALSGNLEGEEI